MVPSTNPWNGGSGSNPWGGGSAPGPILDATTKTVAASCDCYHADDITAKAGNPCGDGGTITNVRWEKGVIGGKDTCVSNYDCQGEHDCSRCEAGDLSRDNEMSALNGCYKLATENGTSGDVGDPPEYRWQWDESLQGCRLSVRCYESHYKVLGRELGWAPSAVIRKDCDKTKPTTTSSTYQTKRTCVDPGRVSQNLRMNEQELKKLLACRVVGEWQPGTTAAKWGDAKYSGCVSNQTRGPIRISFTGNGKTNTSYSLGGGRSTCDAADDIDWVEDASGQWWKISAGVEASITDLGPIFTLKENGHVITPNLDRRWYGYGPLYVCPVTTCNVECGH